MRTLVRAILVASLLATVPTSLTAFAPAMADEATERAAALDALFSQLRDAPDAASAQAIDNQIWAFWTTPADPDLASRMREILIARSIGKVPTALALLDKLVIDFPDYAEGWNQRATLYYVMGDFDRSIADCAKVLELEPRHFGALSGRALMYLQLGQRALALKDMAAALAIHPFLNEAQLFPELARPMTHV
ncbi:tetratricopeptide repeat protein [Devosia sp. CN2-171]|uniref:tetratricopeptide repeat protein n=1 Tax=Devosia sp. CN2-171 TaxID=3400909 RepID=UPI003BF7E469